MFCPNLFLNDEWVCIPLKMKLGVACLAGGLKYINLVNKSTYK